MINININKLPEHIVTADNKLYLLIEERVLGIEVFRMIEVEPERKLIFESMSKEKLIEQARRFLKLF